MPRKLTRAEQSALTRDRVLDAAATMIARVGYEKASLAKIADKAGYTKGAVYSQFSSKGDLLIALFDRRAEAGHQLFVEALEGMDGDVSIPAIFAALERWHHDVGRQRWREWVLLEMELSLIAARNPKFRRRVAARGTEFVERSARLLEQVVDAQGFELTAPAAEITAAIMAMSDGLSMWRLIVEDIARRGVFTQAVSRLILGSVRRKGEAGPAAWA